MTLVVAVLGALAGWYSTRDGGKPPVDETREPAKTVTAPKPGAPRFDFYLMAMTLHPAFCADGHSRLVECSVGPRRMLVIHGLWPERFKAGDYPSDCSTRRLSLDPALEHELALYMPGMSANLHVHEWRKHGTCTGLEDDDYFRRTLALAREIDSALSARLTTLAGRETDAQELRGFADEFQPGLGASLVFQCRTIRGAPERNRPYLVEVRQCLEDDGQNGGPGTPFDCSTVQRRDQGCGQSFMIAGAR